MTLRNVHDIVQCVRIKTRTYYYSSRSTRNIEKVRNSHSFVYWCRLPVFARYVQAYLLWLLLLFILLEFPVLEILVQSFVPRKRAKCHQWEVSRAQRYHPFLLILLKDVQSSVCSIVKLIPQQERGGWCSWPISGLARQTLYSRQLHDPKQTCCQSLHDPK